MEYTKINELIAGYQNKQFSPMETAKAYIERIKKYDPLLQSFITLPEAEILAQAELAEKNFMKQKARKLEGVPVSYKDNINTKNIKTTNGSPIQEHNIPLENAEVVNRLQHAGTVTIGKTNLYEYAFGITSSNPYYGDVTNLWGEGLTAGGSSSGAAAAVAAGFCSASIGTDTAGSVRVPASCTGTVGLKPTYGLIDMQGIYPLSWSLDHSGVLTHNVEDLAEIMNVFTKLQETKQLPLSKVKVGVPSSYFTENINEEVNHFYLEALRKLESLGASLIEIDGTFAAGSIETAKTIATSEVGYVHKEQAKTLLDKYSEGAKAVFRKSGIISAHEYFHALETRKKMKHSLAHIFETVDIIATPTIPNLPFHKSVKNLSFGSVTEDINDTMIRFTSVFNLSGNPAISIPCAFTEEELPVGLQLIGDYFQEERIIHAALAYEKHFLEEFYQMRTKKLHSFIGHDVH
ncbi:amidase [Alkalicoccus daliensis]|uniref:Aspartyl-tRNA(Asn)/glutamyl-tRNA(Gln) amidotransferase subunit A n=1 Tax=Alkalicoccus daliensis TaxID=745820 RepID=A0A1H0GD28_9BACI|nr:amidase [Alkalicoccus daliensis]SDO04782.1 aspartyl-tRNA(Asn)/glutamyl-tRNA(Gln) amidotransferase subunit A [Alkalicoccus daliensis]